MYILTSLQSPKSLLTWRCEREGNIQHKSRFLAGSGNENCVSMCLQSSFHYKFSIMLCVCVCVLGVSIPSNRIIWSERERESEITDEYKGCCRLCGERRGCARFEKRDPIKFSYHVAQRRKRKRERGKKREGGV